jgi:hypothetical protein
MDIQSMQHVLERRKQGKGIHTLTPGFFKIRKKLLSMIVKANSRIETMRTKRNLAIDDDTPVLQKTDITDRSSWFWNGAPAADSSHAFLAESWSALLRQREEVQMLITEYDRWKQNTEIAIDILANGFMYADDIPDDKLAGVNCWRLRHLARLKTALL